MNASEFVIKTTEHGLLIPVKVRAGASKNEIRGIVNGELRVHVTAAPERGKANQAVTNLFAKWLGVPKSNIEIEQGASQPRKTVRIRGISDADLRKMLESTD